MTRDYELGFILHPEVSEDVTRSLLERVQQIVVTHGGQVVKVNQWGRRRLAYPIDHSRDGYYIFVDMILTPETVSEIEHTLQVSEVVLRHMVKRRDPKAVQKEREERAEREARAAAAAEAAAAAAAEAETPPTNEEAPAVSTEAEAEAAPQAAEAEVDQQPTEEAPAEEAPTDNASSTASEPSESSVEA